MGDDERAACAAAQRHNRMMLLPNQPIEADMSFRYRTAGRVSFADSRPSELIAAYE